MLAVHDSYAASIAVTSRLSSLGYSGEHFDAKAQQQYLRARFYNPANGRFNRLDPYAGNMQDPQSLHKYAYVHGDPIGLVDPTGLRGATLGSVSVAMAITVGMGGLSSYANLRAGRSASHGLFSGLVGGTALSVAWHLGRYDVFWEAAITGTVAVLVKNALRYYLTGGGINGGGQTLNRWEISSYFLEGVNWGANYAMWLKPVDGRWQNGLNGIGEHVFGGLIQGFEQLVVAGTSFVADIPKLYQLTKEFEQNPNIGNRSELKALWVDHFDNIIGAAYQAFLGGTADYLVSLIPIAGNLPGIRGQSGRVKAELIEGIITLAFGTGVANVAAQEVDGLSGILVEELVF